MNTSMHFANNYPFGVCIGSTVLALAFGFSASSFSSVRFAGLGLFIPACKALPGVTASGLRTRDFTEAHFS